MRALKTILIILIALVVLAGILVAIGPAETHLVRSTVAQAPAEVVYGRMSDIQRIASWAPWQGLDSTAVTRTEGPDRIGGRYSWESRSLGQGSQAITGLEPHKKVGLDLAYVRPIHANGTADLEIEAMGDSSRILWHFDAKNHWSARILNLFIDLEAMMGPVLERGLADLRTLSEADALALSTTKGTYQGFAITTVERPEISYIGKREIVGQARQEAFLQKQVPLAEKAIGAAGLATTGAPTALFFTREEDAERADLLAGWPVSLPPDTKLNGWQIHTLPAGKALTTVYKGDPSGSRKAHEAIDKMVRTKGLPTKGIVLEEYTIGSRNQTDTALWETRIYHLLQ